MSKNSKYPEPEIGQFIYVPTSLYIDREEDDFQGGVCKITKIDKNYAGEGNIFVEVEENPGVMHNWSYLTKNQEEWKLKYKDRKGKLDYR